MEPVHAKKLDDLDLFSTHNHDDYAEFGSRRDDFVSGVVGDTIFGEHPADQYYFPAEYPAHEHLPHFH